jgi:hypothetical protein
MTGRKFAGQLTRSLSPAVLLVALAAVPGLANESDASRFSGLANQEEVALELEPQALEAEPQALEMVGSQVLEPVPTENVTPLDEILNQNQQESNGLGQVTSISQLSDVRPTDWAFQALQSLVERYGCIAGYPDGTFRGQNFATRFEMAAALNACMDRVSELIAAGLADAVTREDLATLQRLQEEFAAELATLRGRVDALEARVSEVEANQFSTTTKLRGEVLFAITGAIDQDDVFDDQVQFTNRARLNFDTSFTGEDRLRTRLEAENTNRLQGDQLGFQFGGNNDNTFDLDDLIYSFPVGSRTEIVIGTSGLDIDNDFSDSISPLDSSGGGAISEFADPAQYEQAFPGSGAGAGATVMIIDNDDLGLSLDFGYVADNPENEGEGSGLFNGEYATLTQLTLRSDLVDVGVMYSNSYAGSGDEFSRVGRVYDIDFPIVANTFGGQVNFKLADDLIEIGGGIAYSHMRGLGASPDFDVWSWQGTLRVNDLGGDGSFLGILAGVPSYTRELPGESRDTGFLAELFYRYRLNDNIELTPSVIWLADPFNDNDLDDTIIGAFRTRFQF